MTESRLARIGFGHSPRPNGGPFLCSMEFLVGTGLESRDSWRNDTYLFEGVTMGVSVSGVILVKPSQIEIAANLPWLAMPFKGRIETVIGERLRTLLC
jgi:hypothetical protein